MINHQNLFGILEALLKILQHMNKHNFTLDYMNEILEDFLRFSPWVPNNWDYWCTITMMSFIININ